MRLKYYLRGLGIGIILTTLILTISRVNHKMSDQEIINKAMELGMVMKEDPKGNLDEVLEQEKTENSNTPEGSPSPSPEASQAPEATPAVTPVASGETAGTEAPDPSKENTADAASTEQDSTQTDPKTGDTAQATEETSDTTPVTKEPGMEPADSGAAADVTGGSEEITFTIEKGMSSGKVSALLETKGLVEAAVDFNNYIIQEGKSGVIRVGTFTVTKGSSYAEILNTITSRE
jgi:hypothetical protein